MNATATELIGWGLIGLAEVFAIVCFWHDLIHAFHLPPDGKVQKGQGWLGKPGDHQKGDK